MDKNHTQRLSRGTSDINYRFSGHETFPCRYTWLPKVFLAIDGSSEGNRIDLSNEEEAMVGLGVGKNMVRSMRFWALAADVAESSKGEYRATDFGRSLLATFDPYLEDVRTLWLIHWKLSTRIEDPLFAWNYLLNWWANPEISRSEILKAFHKEAKRLGRVLSSITLEQHFDTFLHTYVPTRGRKGAIQEDNLDCPLVELDLIQKIGERKLDSTGKREPIYAFRREDKAEVTPELFTYCLNDFWSKRYPNELELGLNVVANGEGSPGQIFKIPEWDVRKRLENIKHGSGGIFDYTESAANPGVKRVGASPLNLLELIYGGGGQ